MTTVITQTIVVPSMGYDEWWCPCGITPADVIMVFQPKGAADFASSLINLNDPGTNDAIDSGGNTTPTWDINNGWTGESTPNNRYLRSNFTPPNDQSMSMLVRFTNGGDSGYFICGSKYVGQGESDYGLSIGEYTVTYYNNGIWSITDVSKEGVYGFAGNKLYKNGIQQPSEILIGNGITTSKINPLGKNTNDVVYAGYPNSIQAEVWYNKILTPEQMATVSSAMAAL